MGDLLQQADTAASAGDRYAFGWLAAAAIVTVVLWQVPFGNYLLYPFTILATWFHEMGHGLAAMCLGGSFKSLAIHLNGSGVAAYTEPVWAGVFGRAFIAAAGPLGPAVAGSIFLLCSRRPETAHYCLMTLAVALLVSTAVWLKWSVGQFMIAILGAILLAIASGTSEQVKTLVVQFLGVQACLSTFFQWNYLFSKQAVVGGQVLLSDTAQIAEALWLPYWVWGFLISASAVAMLVQSLRYAYRL